MCDLIITNTQLSLATVHSLPCHIQSANPDDDTRAPVEMYFKPTELPLQPNEVTDKTGNKQRYAAQFRGRELQGRKVKLPDYVAGVTLQEPSVVPQHLKSYIDDLNLYVDVKRVVNVDGVFEEVMVWGHDFAPSENENAMEICKEQIELMRAVHS